jgi:hypothetical protein
MTGASTHAACRRSADRLGGECCRVRLPMAEAGRHGIATKQQRQEANQAKDTIHHAEGMVIVFVVCDI